MLGVEGPLSVQGADSLAREQQWRSLSAVSVQGGGKDVASAARRPGPEHVSPHRGEGSCDFVVLLRGWLRWSLMTLEL